MPIAVQQPFFNSLITPNTLTIRHLGITEFEATYLAMQQFTAGRLADTPDELWITEHHPVYTLGLNRKQVRLPIDAEIPLVNTDRGGKITYHGPGQIIVYLLLDLKRNHLTIRRLVTILESSIIALLANYGILARAKPDAPGVYVPSVDADSADNNRADGFQAKIASLGLRVKNNCCYHGLSLNVNMDLTPFSAIDPCGYVGLKVTQTRDLGIDDGFETISALLLDIIATQLTSEDRHD